MQLIISAGANDTFWTLFVDMFYHAVIQSGRSVLALVPQPFVVERRDRARSKALDQAVRMRPLPTRSGSFCKSYRCFCSLIGRCLYISTNESHLREFEGL